MSFSNLPLVWGLLGALAIAGILYLLQRLRVRHQLVEVETTLFWQQAMEESRARVLVQRFRHPWAYLLILAIALLLWLSVAGLRGGGDAQRDHVVLLDGSAAMAIGERFPEVVALANDYVGALPEDARTVVLCGGRVRTVLRPGEESLLLTRRLQDAQPEASPNTVARVLQQFAQVRGDRPITVCVVGEHSLSADELALLPESIEVRQLKVSERTDTNAGITALGVRPAASGKWHNVDVLVEVVGPAIPDLKLDGVAFANAPEVSASAAGSHYRFRDVPAHGQSLLAALPGEDALVHDDHAQFVLPDRRPIAVAVQAGVAAVLRQVLTADAGVVLQDTVDAETRVVIRSVGSDFGGELPALELSTMEQAEDAFLVFHPPGLDPDKVLDELYRGLGLNEIDAMSTSAALGRAVTMGAKPGTRKRLWVWQKLLQPDYDFVNSRSFPLFVGLSIRWLAGFEAGPDQIAVGQPLSLADAAVKHEGGQSRAFSASFVPGLAGSYSMASDVNASGVAVGNRGFAASLLDPHSTGVVDALAAPLPAATTATASGYDLITIFLFLALLLLGVEWLLFRTSRIP
jgi:hypothetical protein